MRLRIQAVIFFAATGVVFVTPPATSAPADSKAVCLAAHGDGQLARKQHELRVAHEKLATCARENCPALVQKDCTRWLAEVEAAQPTVVVVATDEAGKDTLAVRVFVDSTLLRESLDGSPIEIDPGEHVLRFERPGQSAIEERVVLHDGDKARKITVRFGPPTKSSLTSSDTTHDGNHDTGHSSRAIPASTFVFGGLGVVALASWGYFGLTGRSKESSLSASCGGHCSDADVSGVRRRYLVADLSLGVSVVSIGLATYFALSAPAQEQPRASRRLDVNPVAGGAVLTYLARF